MTRYQNDYSTQNLRKKKHFLSFENLFFSFIYVHQTLNDLCIHKLDPHGEDEINSCAPRLEYMATGEIDNMAEQLLVRNKKNIEFLFVEGYV